MLKKVRGLLRIRMIPGLVILIFNSPNSLPSTSSLPVEVPPFSLHLLDFVFQSLIVGCFPVFYLIQDLGARASFLWVLLFGQLIHHG